MYKILIVEDEEITRKRIAYTFDWVSMGCVIIGEASDGVEGERKILELHPDIVITDITMPGQSGMEMIRRTRGKADYKSLILTGCTEFEYAKEAIELKVSRYILKPSSEKEVCGAVRELCEELEAETEVKRICMQYKRGVDPQEYIGIEKYENPYVRRMLEMIRERYHEKLSIDEIAAEIGVSASYLSRKCKEVTGHTYLDHLNSYRLSQAIKLMRSGGYKIYEISDKTGFTDYKHFSAVFKKYTGVSPTEFTRAAVV
jgi:two-component system response regulator YesN